MHDPREEHWLLLKRSLRYVRGTPCHGVHLHASPSRTLTAYTDADWARCPDTRRSTSGFCIYLDDALVSWSSKRQAVVSQSSAEAEYRGVANAAGCVTCCTSFTSTCTRQVSFFATMSLLFISRITQFTTKEPSMWSSTFILCVNGQLWDNSGCYMCQRNINLRIL